MLRVLLFVLAVFAVGLGLAWLADRPGDMVVTFEGYQYRFTLMFAAVAVVAIVAAAMIVWWLVKSLWNSPHRVARFFRARRRDRGYQALSTGMIAAGAGDAPLARRKNREAIKLIRSDQEPLIHLLDAQASLLEGDHAGARTKFEAMVADPETRLLGLRGLFLEAERLGDRAAARHYAARAAEAAPQLAWAAESTLEERVERGDWDAALRLVEARVPDSADEKALLNRRRAVLLTAKANAILDPDPHGARTAALEANRIEPDFVPAAVAAARALFRLDDLKRGARILEAAWKREAHPDIAELYVHARSGDSTHDRLHRARKLAGMRQNNPQSSLAVARAALAAHEYAEAREAAEAALRMAPTEGAFLLLADIAAAEGDEGRVRQFLAKALRAPQDPAWVADGVVSDRWAPLSPVSGRLDAFEWRAPVERLAQPVLTVEDEAPEHPALAATIPTPAAEAADLPPLFAEAAPPQEEAPIPVEPAPFILDPPPAVAPVEPSAEVVELRPAAAAPPEPPPTGPTPPEPENEVPVRPPLPDDPGVEPGAEPARRFRLF